MPRRPTGPAPGLDLATLELICVKVCFVSPVESDEQDLTRKERREQARAQRKAMEEAAAASAVRRQRLTQLGIVAAIVIIAVVVIVIATGGGGKKAVGKGTAKGNENVAAVSALLAGIPQSGSTLGATTAPATLQYFGDLQCPICRDFTVEGDLKEIIEKYVRPGKLRIEYRSMETATHEPEIFRTQQVAALAAGKQGKAWNYIELFYHDQGEENSGYVNESFLQGLAQQVPGLNLAQWSSDRNSNELANQVAGDVQAANNLGLTGTPAFLIGRTGGQAKHIEPSITEAGSFDKPIEEATKS
jgi:protein-disulfide isomerase